MNLMLDGQHNVFCRAGECPPLPSLTLLRWGRSLSRGLKASCRAENARPQQ